MDSLAEHFGTRWESILTEFSNLVAEGILVDRAQLRSTLAFFEIVGQGVEELADHLNLD